MFAVAVEAVGNVGPDPAVPIGSGTPTIGTAAAELTPRLPISVDPNGIPVRATPPGAIGDVADDPDDEAMLPEPHIPDIPDVSMPEVAETPDEVDIPDDVGIPAVAAVAGVSDPMAVPPPSKVAVDPNMPEGEVPAVEHVVPPPGMAMVPDEAGAGLIPGDASSVEPKGMPVGDTGEPVAIPSGEVAPMLGVGVAIAPTCAIATWQVMSTATIAATSENLIGARRKPTGLPLVVVWRCMVGLTPMRRLSPRADPAAP